MTDFELIDTTLYRNRFNPDRLVNAVQYTRENDQAVYEWAPGKQHHEPGGRINGMNVFTPDGRRRAVWGDWIYHDCGSENFWVASSEAFADSYEQVGS
jgi:hypothetical protein